jgi:HSP20 family protein
MNSGHSVRVDVGPPKGDEQNNPTPSTKPARPAEALTPFLDIHEGPEGLILEADLPGVAQNDVTIQLEDNVLTLHARVTAPVPTEARLIHEEYRHGDFHRSFILSDEVDREKISAELKNGVLRLNLPKAERARTRRIEIKSS